MIKQIIRYFLLITYFATLCVFGYFTFRIAYLNIFETIIAVPYLILLFTSFISMLYVGFAYLNNNDILKQILKEEKKFKEIPEWLSE